MCVVAFVHYLQYILLWIDHIGILYFLFFILFYIFIPSPIPAYFSPADGCTFLYFFVFFVFYGFNAPLANMAGKYCVPGGAFAVVTLSKFAVYTNNAVAGGVKKVKFPE